jgi:hypothetical protein
MVQIHKKFTDNHGRKPVRILFSGVSSLFLLTLALSEVSHIALCEPITA